MAVTQNPCQGISVVRQALRLRARLQRVNRIIARLELKARTKGLNAK